MEKSKTGKEKSFYFLEKEIMLKMSPQISMPRLGMNSKLGSSDIKALALTLSSICAYSVRLAQQWLPGA